MGQLLIRKIFAFIQTVLSLGLFNLKNLLAKASIALPEVDNCESLKRQSLTAVW